MERMKERDSGIERIRVIACFLVIVNHIQVALVIENGMFFNGRALLYAFIEQNIPLFMMITGFFMFQNIDMNCLNSIAKRYTHKLRNFFLHIFVPSVIVVLVSAFLYSFIVGEKSFAETFLDPEFQGELLKNYIFLQQADYICVHLWYIWTYARIVLCFPLLAFICQNSKDKNLIRRFFMELSIINIAFVDVEAFFNIGKGNFDSIVFDQYFLCILLGYEIWLLFLKNKDQWAKIRICGFVIMLIGILGKTVLQSIYFSHFAAEYHTTVFAILPSVGLFCALYTQKKIKAAKFWSWLGENTLYIYLVHVAVMFCCNNICDQYFWKLFGAGKNILSFVIYDLAYGSIILGSSLVIGIIMKVLYENVLLMSIRQMFRGTLLKRRDRNE